MSKKSNFLSYLKGESSKVPYSFWTHLPQYDLDAELLAVNTYEFYKKFQMDFIKTMPNGMFAIEDFGCECDYSEIEKGGVAKVTKMAVNKIEDWDNINELDILEGAYGRELKSIKRLKELLGNDDVPVLATEFSPFTIAAKLSNNLVLEHIKQAPEKVERALEVISKCVIKHSNECIKLGCAGIFFAQQMAQSSVTSKEEYLRFGAKWDKYVLSNLDKNAYFSVAHIHGDDIHFDTIKDYPIEGISFHVYETKPEVSDFMKESNFVLVGGIERGNITNRKKDTLKENISNSIKQSIKGRIVVAPGCVIRYPVDDEIISYCIEEVKSHGI